MMSPRPLTPRAPLPSTFASRPAPPWRSPLRLLGAASLVGIVMALAACGGSDASDLGVGGSCKSTSDCPSEAPTCLTNFKGGYCGIKGCKADSDCPSGADCVAHTDGVNYCFLVCADKSECNANRSTDVEANCSSNVSLVGGQKDVKVCVPPS